MLGLLLRMVEVAYRGCSVDRRRLHDIEWGNDDDAISIIGEVEVRADEVTGVALTLLKKKRLNGVAGVIESLEDRSVYESDNVVRWLVENGGEFVEFMCYISAVENLRFGLVSVLRREL